jgi:hypothetical protein
MADNQMVKIVFDFDLGNVPASAKKLSQYLKDNNLDLKFTKKSVDDLAASMNQLGTAQTKAGNAAAAAGNSVKKSNIQWMNLALVVQDLPYGFRGIQNNLPALLGGIAGVGGAAYLAFSAIIAGLTMWDEHNRKVAASAKKVKEEQDAVLSSISNEAVKVNELIIILESENETRDRKKRALKDLQAINPDIFKDLKLEGDKVKNLNTYYDSYIQNLKNVILLKQYEKDLEALIQADLKAGKPIKVEEQKQLKKTTDLLNLNNTAVKDNITTAKVSNGKDQNIIKGITNYNKRQQEKLDLLEKIKKISPSISLTGGGVEKADTNKKEISDRENALKTIIENERNAALELYDERDKELRQITSKYREQIDLATRYGQETIVLEEAWRAELSAIRKKWNDKDAAEEEKNNKERIAKGQKNYQDSINAVNEFYQNKLNLATGDKNQQIAILKEEQTYFDLLYGFNLISYEDYVKKTGEITKQQIGINNALIKSSAEATLQLGMAIMSALAPAFDMMVEKGASIGEALESVFTNLLKQLAKVIVTAAIAVALMAALGLVDFAAIGSTFKMLVSQGMGLPKMGAGAGGGVSQPLTMFDGFANGGIISGPTYGLMGEYPGAQNNPEVVAPLDKLKDMIGGGGGGTFMLRGQDLLLSVNRAQKASNLKGQNISLV